MDLSDCISRLAAQRRLRWVARHGRRPTPIEGPEGTLYAFDHPRGKAPVLPVPVRALAFTPELAWRAAYDPIALKIAFRGRLTALLCPLLARGECEGLRPEDLLPCDTLDFRRRRSAVLNAMHRGEAKRAVLRFHDLLLAQLWALPPDPPDHEQG